MDFNFSTATWMLLFFILFLAISIWKISAFLPNKPLLDDDKTEEATEELEKLMLKVILQKKGLLDEKELFFAMSKDEDFNSELFWRFNLNRLKNLLRNYYTKNPSTTNITSIYTHLNK